MWGRQCCRRPPFQAKTKNGPANRQPPDLHSPQDTVIERATSILTVLSMAALGLDVDLGSLRQVGARATLAVTLSLLGLIAISYALIRAMWTA